MGGQDGEPGGWVGGGGGGGVGGGKGLRASKTTSISTQFLCASLIVLVVFWGGLFLVSGVLRGRPDTACFQEPSVLFCFFKRKEMNCSVRLRRSEA